MITIAVQVYNFQRRFSWMLSSIQHQLNSPDISIDVSTVNGNGNPTCEELSDLYPDLNISIHHYDIETLQYRGLTRTDAIKRCDTDWLLFADCDMVYNPLYFRTLADWILHSECNWDDHVLTAGRYSNDIEKANGLVAAENYDRQIRNPWKMADRRLNKIKRGNVGAGYFQLINVNECDHGGYYVTKEENRDQSWLTKWAKASSDRQFRRRIGKVKKLPRWFSQNQIHLNHYRDNGNGVRPPKHLTEQR